MPGWLLLLLPVLVVTLLVMAFWHQFKPLPDGLGAAGPLRTAEDVVFLADYTYADTDGRRHFDHAIFDEVLRLVGQARQLVVLDMFLYNEFAGESTAAHRPLTAELTAALVRRKTAIPSLPVVVITDPFNTLYGSIEPAHFSQLREAGVEVIVTDTLRLRDSNPTWSAVWRLCCQWFGNDDGGGWLPNPVGPDRVTLRTYLQLLNFNANHRKTLVVDEGDRWTGMVLSANPHDASSAHSNVALRFSGAAALDLLETEQAVAAMSGASIPWPESVAASGQDADGRSGGDRLQILTESRIRDAVLAAMGQARPGEQLDLAMFYFSHRTLIRALIAAHDRGVDVRVLLDPNEDAFGRKKNGIPNRQVAWELHDAGVPVRWCNTRGEQCHSKMMRWARTDGSVELILGSANFTRRNLDDYNLETSVRLVGQSESPAVRDAGRFMERYWHDPADRRLSLDYARHADTSLLRYWQYRVMEATGMSTF